MAQVTVKLNERDLNALHLIVLDQSGISKSSNKILKSASDRATKILDRVQRSMKRQKREDAKCAALARKARSFASLGL